MNPLDASIRELRGAIVGGQTTVSQVVEAHIQRVREVNPALNALVVERFDAARDEAAAADAWLADHGPDAAPPLFGIPCSVKEFVGVQGMPNTAGIGRNRGKVAAADATAVERLRQAGAIVLGLSNVPDGGIWMETYNPIYGRTSNPWSTARTPGGSSGGDGALVASGAVSFGLAADIGGSIRIPAALCGAMGHKPTGGTIPNTGAHAPSGVVTGRYHSLGPIARRAEDLMTLTRVMAGPDGACPSVVERPLGDVHRVRLDRVTVHVVTDNGRASVQPEVAAAVRRVADALVSDGATVRPIEAGALKHSFEIWAAMLAEGNDESYRDVLACGEPFSYARELARVALRRGDFSSPALIIGLLSDALDKLPGSQDHWVEAGRAAQAELEAQLGEDGVLLCPTFPVTAPLHRGLLLRPFAHTFVCLFNVLELPATTVPVGFDGLGLPMGAQVVGRRGNDHLTIAVARAIEQFTGGWVRTDPVITRRRDELMKWMGR